MELSREGVVLRPAGPQEDIASLLPTASVISADTRRLSVGGLTSQCVVLSHCSINQCSTGRESRAAVLKVLRFGYEHLSTIVTGTFSEDATDVLNISYSVDHHKINLRASGLTCLKFNEDLRKFNSFCFRILSGKKISPSVQFIKVPIHAPITTGHSFINEKYFQWDRRRQKLNLSNKCHVLRNKACVCGILYSALGHSGRR